MRLCNDQCYNYVTLIAFQGHCSVKQFQLNIWWSYSIKLKLCTSVEYVKWIMNTQLFLFLHMLKEDNWHDIFSFEKKKIVGFLSDSITARSFKLCMVITVLGVYIVIVNLMTLTLFQGHTCVRNINCKMLVLDSYPL